MVVTFWRMRMKTDLKKYIKISCLRLKMFLKEFHNLKLLRRFFCYYTEALVLLFTMHLNFLRPYNYYLTLCVGEGIGNKYYIVSVIIISMCTSTCMHLSLRSRTLYRSHDAFRNSESSPALLLKQ